MPPTTAREPEVLERELAPTLPAQAGGSVDAQVATAKRFPRSVESFMRRATEMSTLTPEIAAACVYALPREGKMIEGPSARLAEIVMHAWGNMRAQAGSEGDAEDGSPFIIGYGEAWDLEANTAVRFEVRRRITKTSGKRYGDDMIAVTGNAAAAIAFRNAIFKAVPSPFWRPIYLKCRQVIAGEAQTFAVRRDEMIKKFHVMGVTNEQLYAVLGVKGIADVTLDHMVQITGAYNALKEGEMSVDEFVASAATVPPKPAQRVSQQPPASSAPAPVAPVAEIEPEAPAPAASTSPAANVGTIVHLHDRGNGAAIVELNTGFTASTRDEAMQQSVVRLRDAKTLVELETTPSSDPAKYAPKLTGILPLQDAEAAQ